MAQRASSWTPAFSHHAHRAPDSPECAPDGRLRKPDGIHGLNGLLAALSCGPKARQGRGALDADHHVQAIAHRYADVTASGDQLGQTILDALLAVLKAAPTWPISTTQAGRLRRAHRSQLRRGRPARTSAVDCSSMQKCRRQRRASAQLRARVAEPSRCAARRTARCTDPANAETPVACSARRIGRGPGLTDRRSGSVGRSWHQRGGAAGLHDSGETPDGVSADGWSVDALASRRYCA